MLNMKIHLIANLTCTCFIALYFLFVDLFASKILGGKLLVIKNPRRVDYLSLSKTSVANSIMKPLKVVQTRESPGLD